MKRSNDDVSGSQARRRTDGKPVAPTRQRRSLSGVTVSLIELGKKLRRMGNLDDVLLEVTKTAVVLTRSSQGTIRLLDDSGKRLLTSARYGPSVHRRGAPPFRYGEGFIGWVVAHRRAACTNSPASDPRFIKRQGQLFTPAAVIAVPLMNQSDCIGVLSASRRGGPRYTELDLNLLSLVGQLSEPQLEIARLRRLGESDPLTLLHNRRHLDQHLPVLLQKAARSGKPLALAMLDLDHFKHINDQFGHDVGDEVLCQFAERLKRAARSTDILVRWGGEEFIVVLLDTTSGQAKMVCERIRSTISAEPVLTSAGPIQLTVSMGLAFFKTNDVPATLLKRADEALYNAKRKGRNRLVVAGRTQR
ncbi:MAG: GGDEF domain-containing protein [Deltaproteobacteria bacterium]|nr:MAG: GGDEF domain-containing protein [Deltaproteobacteria bacterium]